MFPIFSDISYCVALFSRIEIETASKVAYPAVSQAMRRARRKMQPALPTDLKGTQGTEWWTMSSFAEGQSVQTDLHPFSF